MFDSLYVLLQIDHREFSTTQEFRIMTSIIMMIVKMIFTMRMLKPRMITILQVNVSFFSMAIVGYPSDNLTAYRSRLCIDKCFHNSKGCLGAPIQASTTAFLNESLRKCALPCENDDDD